MAVLAALIKLNLSFSPYSFFLSFFLPLQDAMNHVRSNTSVRPLSADAKIGAHGTPVFFLHPKDMHGVLTEFEQVKAIDK
jgi:hypothetical protein